MKLDDRTQAAYALLLRLSKIELNDTQTYESTIEQVERQLIRPGAAMEHNSGFEDVFTVITGTLKGIQVKTKNTYGQLQYFINIQYEWTPIPRNETKCECKKTEIQTAKELLSAIVKAQNTFSTYLQTNKMFSEANLKKTTYNSYHTFYSGSMTIHPETQQKAGIDMDVYNGRRAGNNIIDTDKKMQLEICLWKPS